MIADWIEHNIIDRIAYINDKCPLFSNINPYIVEFAWIPGSIRNMDPNTKNFRNMYYNKVFIGEFSTLQRDTWIKYLNDNNYIQWVDKLKRKVLFKNRHDAEWFVISIVLYGKIQSKNLTDTILKCDRYYRNNLIRIGNSVYQIYKSNILVLKKYDIHRNTNYILGLITKSTPNSRILPSFITIKDVIELDKRISDYKGYIYGISDIVINNREEWRNWLFYIDVMKTVPSNI